MSLLHDPRKHREYQIAELVMGGIMLFTFKSGSRNAFDNDRKESNFCKNYYRCFKMRLPSTDAVEDLYRALDMSELEQIKTVLVKELLERKVFYRFRFLSKKYLISIDGTGVASYDNDYCGECTHKTSKNGVTTYFHNVLEAKLVTHNDMAFSIATEWIRNAPGKEYNKQDCELKAFKRLAAKIKKAYPRMPIVILADGLYANQSFFKICQDNGWDFIVTFKEGNLPSVHQELNLLPQSAASHSERFIGSKKGYSKSQKLTWHNNMDYCGFNLSSIICHEEKTFIKSGKKEKRTFHYLTNMDINSDNSYVISDSGRLRWRIENSFDYLKNHGYNLGHKFSRVSFLALKNWYQSMMLAHMLNQLVEKSIEICAILDKNSKCTIDYLWKRLWSFFNECDIENIEYEKFVKKRCRLRLV